MSEYKRGWLFTFVFYGLGLAAYLISMPESVSSGDWIVAAFVMTFPALLLAFLANGIVQILKATDVRKHVQPESKPAEKIPPPPVGWNKTMADLWAEVEAGVRKSINHPEMDWAIEYERRTAPPSPPEDVKRKWEIAARTRNCYCSVWGTNPAKFKEEGLPEGFCGMCERCSKPGHTRHFPGPIPYTGSWCDKCYRILAWTWPFRSARGWVYLLAVAMIVFAIAHPIIKRTIG